MSTVISLKEISQLHKVYQALHQGASEPEQLVGTLPDHFREKISLNHKDNLSKSRQLLSSIRDFTHDIYDRESQQGKANIHAVFYRCCGASNTGDRDWGRHHIKDEDKVDFLLRSLEMTSAKKEVLEWAGTDTYRLVAAEKIIGFLSSTETELNLSNLHLKFLPDIFDNAIMRNRLQILNLSHNQLQSFEGLESLQSLTCLNVSYNQLESLSGLESLPSLEILNVSYNHLESLSGLESLSSLSDLNASHNQLESLSELEALTSLTTLRVDSNILDSLEGIEGLNSLVTLSLYSNQLESLAGIEDLTSLTSLNVSDNQIQTLEELENLTSLSDLDVSLNPLQSIPEFINSLTNLSSLNLKYTSNLRTLPNSIVNLPANCTVYLERSGLSNRIIDRLREAIEQSGYEGPRFYFSIQDYNHMLAPQNLDTSLASVYTKAERQDFTDVQTTFPAIHECISQSSLKNSSLQNWLSRLALMHPNAKEVDTGLYVRILSYLQLAEKNTIFREQFFTTIQEASETCGDRMALSVLHLGLQQKMILIDKTDLKGYADFLIHGQWMLDHLETIARAKVSTLHLVDEIEVYLGYPVKLRDRLNLQIDVKDMIWFSFSEITQQDLDNAACYIEEQISTPDAIANILAQREDWVRELRTMYQEEISSFESTKLSKLDALKESDVESYKKIQEEYIDNIMNLTKNILTS